MCRYSLRHTCMIHEVMRTCRITPSRYRSLSFVARKLHAGSLRPSMLRSAAHPRRRRAVPRAAVAPHCPRPPSWLGGLPILVACAYPRSKTARRSQALVELSEDSRSEDEISRGSPGIAREAARVEGSRRSSLEGAPPSPSPLSGEGVGGEGRLPF